MIKPHGGVLINNIYKGDISKRIAQLGKKDNRLTISEDHIQDIKNIAKGAYSPLSGFLHEDDFLRVISDMRLSDGVVWPIPIVLDVNKDDRKRLRNHKSILLVNKINKPVAILKNISFYKYNKSDFANKVFGTLRSNHPGVADVFRMKEYLVGGDIEFSERKEEKFTEFSLSPKDMRLEFNRRRWKSVVAFQTRNVPHRGHEFLQREALKITDGLLIQPVIGKKKHNDFKDECIISSYKILIENYYPAKKVVLGTLPLKMRYAGPREAILHALIRKNYGCTHFIVGRDHAGVGDFYKPDAAQNIFDDFSKDEIGIKILKFPEVVYDTAHKRHCFINECNESDRMHFSGTKLRNYIKNKQKPPKYLIHSKIYELLANFSNPLVDKSRKTNKNKKGFVLWFTGLSGAGKSTIADGVFETLKINGIKIERLDGDVVRENLTKSLGFTKEDRDENIKRIGFVASLLSRNDVGVIASFISPYQKQREELQRNVNNYIEIYVNAPLEVCEERDPKGLYKKARRGEIKNFTGISDPYDEPRNPALELRTDKATPEECIAEVINFINKKGYIHEDFAS
ncbi:MAG: sulfate adenylyltransferase [Patescibacteria group bacterium]|nr:sulfate adenylyltransferase [Patescibacteria group bacterium]